MSKRKNKNIRNIIASLSYAVVVIIIVFLISNSRVKNIKPVVVETAVSDFHHYYTIPINVDTLSMLVKNNYCNSDITFKTNKSRVDISIKYKKQSGECIYTALEWFYNSNDKLLVSEDVSDINEDTPYIIKRAKGTDTLFASFSIIVDEKIKYALVPSDVIYGLISYGANNNS